MSKLTWQVTENNGGGLTLYVWDGDALIYAHAGYEYAGAALADNLRDLDAGSSPIVAQWDGNDLVDEGIIHAVRDEQTHDAVIPTEDMSPLTHNEYYDDSEYTKLICDQDGPVDLDDMGGAGKTALANYKR